MILSSNEVKQQILRIDDFFIKTEFEFINHLEMTGAYNMDFDMQRADDLAKGAALPMFRLYAWKPYCVSLGYNQKRDRIDEELCYKNEFDIVRRPTGGRAVLHSKELTYCVVTKISKEMNQQDLYRDIHIFLVKAFADFAPALDFEKSQTNFRTFYEKDPSSVSCFASSARYEIMFENRKIVGSAQRLFGDVLLQHGSILLDAGHERLADVIISNSETERERIRQSILQHSATLSEVAGREISYTECANAIEKELGIKS